MSSALPVLLTRHGLSEHNLVTQFYMGRSPASRLVPEGQRQARALGRYLAAHRNVDRIVASSLPRTLETAELVAGELGGVPVQGDDALWELSKGEWEGKMPRDGVPEPARSELLRRPFGFQFPGGESYVHLAARVMPAFEHWRAEFSGERLLFVLHGDVLSLLLQQLLKLPPDSVASMAVKPCSLTELVPEPSGWRMVRFGQVVPIE